jgi:hypothetical protein
MEDTKSDKVSDMLGFQVPPQLSECKIENLKNIKSAEVCIQTRLSEATIYTCRNRTVSVVHPTSPTLTILVNKCRCGLFV